MTGDARPSQEQPGAQIGRYKLLEQIGEGGMGTIWMAEQREPVKRRVALKIIKLGMDTKQVIARFEAERQALAMMDHPNIAKVLDAGATDAGRPYFVMEYIRGIPILEYCDLEKVDTKARLTLFADVCHAIQHAHQKGIIHRDIKPDNVLVTMHDGVPVPKVIDFGIAKATNAELTTKTLFTEHRQMVGTPAYMSPEQSEMSGLDIDTRSDVYSLGVLLYELLTGTTPFDMKHLLESGFAEMMRTIREVEPHKPSTRISTLGETASRTAQLRHVDSKKLGTLLRGDLDWIVMKCLEKDRTRRYDTANGLAADIKRHLGNEPVTAGAPSTAYRLHKFVKRNRLQVFAAGAVAATLTLGIVAFAWQANEAREQRDAAVTAKNSEAEQRRAADAARTEAEIQETLAKEQEAEARKQEAEAKKQAAIAEAIAKFQTDMLAAADPDKLLGDRVTVMQAMEAAIQELDKGSLADQPLVEAGVRYTIGGTLIALGRPDDAVPILRKSLAIRREILSSRSAGTTFSMRRLASALLELNELAEAEALNREALAITRELARPGDPAIAACLSQLAHVLRDQDRVGDAVPLCREAVEIAREAYSAGDPELADELNGLAALRMEQNEFVEAASLFREALRIMRGAFPSKHPRIARQANNLAVLLGRQGELDEAESLFRESLEIYRDALPTEHPQLGVSLSQLASALAPQGKFAEAEPLYDEALPLLRQSLPAGHPHIAHTLSGMAVLHWRQGRLDRSVPMFEEIVEMAKAAYGPDHIETLTAIGNLGVNYKDAGRIAEAIPLLEEAALSSAAQLELSKTVVPALLDAYHQAPGPPDPDVVANVVAKVRVILAGERTRMGKDIPAIEKLLASYLVVLGGTLWARNDWQGAEQRMREAVEVRERVQPDAWHTFDAKSRLGAALLKQGKAADARPLLLAGYQGMKEREASMLPRDRSKSLVWALSRLVWLNQATDNPGEAAAWQRKFDALRAELARPAKGDEAEDPAAQVARAWQLLDSDPAAALALAEKAVDATRSVKVAPLQVLAEALFASGKPDDAAAKMQRALRAWQSTRSQQKKALGERDFAWMQSRLEEYRK